MIDQRVEADQSITSRVVPSTMNFAAQWRVMDYRKQQMDIILALARSTSV